MRTSLFFYVVIRIFQIILKKVCKKFGGLQKVRIFTSVNKTKTHTMKINNNINIDFGSNNERVYELTIECRNEEEIDSVFESFEGVKNFTIDCFEDLEVTVIVEAWRFQTKKEFIKTVRGIVK
ncbi:MAG: hypothetical protein Unbinned221contig1000_16 [Prokaryotic dsDNA virus sp.]|nr:MAG: hypothetical protein Unbinned221contig1000_16 [Prokaryotic dsDNA virus sp.]